MLLVEELVDVDVIVLVVDVEVVVVLVDVEVVCILVDVEVLVDVDDDVDVDVDVEVEVVVVSQPVHVLSHWALKLTHKPVSKIVWHCAKDNVLRLFAQR